MNPQKKTSPWAWIPTLYFAQGLPYVAVMTISVIMYKRLGISNTDIALYTSWLYLPWVIKPFWSPFIDLLKTKRWWVVTMQMLVGAGLAGIAFTIPAPHFFQITLAIFWLVAFSSATHDIAADGFYMLALDTHDQAMYVGIRSTFYRVATIAGQGLLVILAGLLESNTGLTPLNLEIKANSNTVGLHIANMLFSCCTNFLPCDKSRPHSQIVQFWLADCRSTMWVYSPFRAYSSAGLPCSATMPPDSTTT